MYSYTALGISASFPYLTGSLTSFALSRRSGCAQFSPWKAYKNIASQAAKSFALVSVYIIACYLANTRASLTETSLCRYKSTLLPTSNRFTKVFRLHSECVCMYSAICLNDCLDVMSNTKTMQLVCARYGATIGVNRGSPAQSHTRSFHLLPAR